MEQMTSLFTCSVPVSSIHGHSTETLVSKARGDMRGSTLLLPKGASPLSPCSRCSPFQCSYQGAKEEDEFCWPLALLMVVKEPAQVSVPSQLQQLRTEMFTVPGISTNPTSPPHTLWKHLGAFLFFIFLAVWKNKCLAMVTSQWIWHRFLHL